MTVDPRAVAQVIRDLARAEALPLFQNLGQGDIDRSTPGDIVTKADHRMEEVLSERLPPLLTGSSVIGEEGVKANPGLLGALDRDTFTWIVDPIDGTRNFAAGNPDFCIIVALARAGRAQAGWIYAPVPDQMLLAVKDAGAQLNGQDFAAPAVNHHGDLGQMTGSIGPRRGERLNKKRDAGTPNIPEIRPRIGSAGREYMDLALGRIDFLGFVGPLRPWDHVAGTLINRELGKHAAMAPEGGAYDATANRPNGESLLTAPDEVSWAALSKLVTGS